MYEAFYGLREKPFNLTPDPRFIYFSEKHSEALANLVYGVRERKGFLVLTGEVGTGKTTLANALLDTLERASVLTVFLFNPVLSRSEFFEYLLADLNLKAETGSKSQALIRLNSLLLDRYRSGAMTVLVVDEAQNLSTELLEEIRLLTNLETATEKLLQIVLLGQPELSSRLNSPELRQLKQRISLRCNLSPLTPSETQEYIRARLETAGLPNQQIFPASCIGGIYRYSGGVPRLINSICDNALLTGYATDQKAITAEIIQEVCTDLNLAQEDRPSPAAVTHRKTKELIDFPRVQASSRPAAVRQEEPQEKENPDDAEVLLNQIFAQPARTGEQPFAPAQAERAAGLPADGDLLPAPQDHPTPSAVLSMDDPLGLDQPQALDRELPAASASAPESEAPAPAGKPDSGSNFLSSLNESKSNQSSHWRRSLLAGLGIIVVLGLFLLREHFSFFGKSAELLTLTADEPRAPQGAIESKPPSSAVSQEDDSAPEDDSTPPVLAALPIAAAELTESESAATPVKPSIPRNQVVFSDITGGGQPPYLQSWKRPILDKESLAQVHPKPLVFRIRIDRQGQVIRVTPLNLDRSNSSFGRTIIETVQQWVFTPLKDGETDTATKYYSFRIGLES